MEKEKTSRFCYFKIVSLIAVIIILLIVAGVLFYSTFKALDIKVPNTYDQALFESTLSEETLQKITDAGFVVIDTKEQLDGTYLFTLLSTKSIGQFSSDEAEIEAQMFSSVFHNYCTALEIPLSVLSSGLPSYRMANSVTENCEIADTSAWLSTPISSGMHWCIDKDKNVTYGEDMYSYECFPIVYVTEYAKE